MSNTYAINTTRGKEFEVRDELAKFSSVWVPTARISKRVKERKGLVWYDRPYISKLAFCTFPAVYYRDVCEMKHVIGKPLQLKRHDMASLETFKGLVEAEYADAKRCEENQQYVCKYKPGQALEILSGPFEGFRAVFQGQIKRAHEDFAKLRIGVEMMGQQVSAELPPDLVSEA